MVRPSLVRLVRALVLAGLLSGALVRPALADTLFYDDFNGYPNGLITSEFTHWNPDSPFATPAANWDVTSGALFSDAVGEERTGYSGVPTYVDGRSSPWPGKTFYNNSAVFRMVTTGNTFGDATVSFRLLVDGLSSTDGTPPVAWDGVHVFLRYQDEANLYYASVDRRDGVIVIKKKVGGGTTNGGTYYTLASTKRGTFPIPFGTWQDITVGVHTNTDGSVSIFISRDGTLALTATDNGTVGGPPILAAGRTGLRGDNAEFHVDDFLVDGPAS